MNTFLMQLSAQAENRFYGHIDLLAKYCGLEGRPWLNGYLQHGWNATDGFGNYLGSKRYSNKYVWSKRCESIIKSSGKKNVFAIGAPWIYLEDVYPQTVKETPSGTIAYPAHSSTWSKMGDTNSQYAKYLDDNYGKVTVVLHRYDFADVSIRQSYESVGHLVTTHGIGTPWENGFNPLFLKNQRDLLSKFSKIVSNSVSTAILYATSLGLTAEIGGPIDYSVTNADDITAQIGDGRVNWNQEMSDESNQQKIWKNELGLDCKRSPHELKEILGWNLSQKKSKKFFMTRTIDLITGSSKSISFSVFKSTVKR